jgi:predicted flavoprotein YhiN
LSGLSFPHATIHRSGENGQKQSHTGPMLLTHFGVTGPAIFAFAAHIPYTTIDAEHPFDIYIQPFADRDVQWRLMWLQQMSIEHPKKQIKTILQTQFADRLVDVYLSTYSIPISLKRLEKSSRHL